jgi:hypothetical protein
MIITPTEGQTAFMEKLRRLDGPGFASMQRAAGEQGSDMQLAGMGFHPMDGLPFPSGEDQWDFVYITELLINGVLQPRALTIRVRLMANGRVRVLMPLLG